MLAGDAGPAGPLPRPCPCAAGAAGAWARSIAGKRNNRNAATKYVDFRAMKPPRTLTVPRIIPRFHLTLIPVSVRTQRHKDTETLHKTTHTTNLQPWVLRPMRRTPARPIFESRIESEINPEMERTK